MMSNGWNNKRSGIKVSRSQWGVSDNKLNSSVTVDTPTTREQIEGDKKRIKERSSETTVMQLKLIHDYWWNYSLDSDDHDNVIGVANSLPWKWHLICQEEWDNWNRLRREYIYQCESIVVTACSPKKTKLSSWVSDDDVDSFFANDIFSSWKEH